MSRTYSAKDFKFLVLKKKKKPYIIVEGKDDSNHSPTQLKQEQKPLL